MVSINLPLSFLTHLFKLASTTQALRLNRGVAVIAFVVYPAKASAMRERTQATVPR